MASSPAWWPGLLWGEEDPSGRSQAHPRSPKGGLGMSSAGDGEEPREGVVNSTAVGSQAGDLRLVS